MIRSECTPPPPPPSALPVCAEVRLGGAPVDEVVRDATSLLTLLRQLEGPHSATAAAKTTEAGGVPIAPAPLPWLRPRRSPISAGELAISATEISPGSPAGGSTVAAAVQVVGGTGGGGGGSARALEGGAIVSALQLEALRMTRALHEERTRRAEVKRRATMQAPTSALTSPHHWPQPPATMHAPFSLSQGPVLP